MAKPPPDVNPENFVIGRGLYSNYVLAVPYEDASVFRIDPAPQPYASIVVLNALFVSFFCGFHWLLRRYGTDVGVFGLYVAPIGIGLMTCIGFTAITVYWFGLEHRRGTWLTYDKASGRVTLPRLCLCFERTEIVYVQYITTKRLGFGGVMNNDQVSELNLVTMRDGKRERWPLLGSTAYSGVFKKVLDPMVRSTGLPVVRVRDEWLGWNVTVEPYVPK